MCGANPSVREKLGVRVGGSLLIVTVPRVELMVRVCFSAFPSCFDVGIFSFS